MSSSIQTKLKKAAVILLSFLLFLTSSNYIFLFIERLETIKSEMNEKIFSRFSDSELLALKFSSIDFKSKINWRDSNEFELSGNLYDVVKIEKRNNEYIIYCFNDSKEETLIASFKNLNEKSGDHKYFVLEQLHMIVLQAIQNDVWILKLYHEQNEFVRLITKKYSSVISDIQTPPPKFNS